MIMRKIYEIRLINVRNLASKYSTNAEFARKLEREPTQISRFMGKNPTKMIGDKLADDIENKLGLIPGELDVDHTARTIKELEESIGRLVLSTPKEVQDVVQALVTRYQTDEENGTTTARAIKTLLGI